jgi:hypothetical protein
MATGFYGNRFYQHLFFLFPKKKKKSLLFRHLAVDLELGFPSDLFPSNIKFGH